MKVNLIFEYCGSGYGSHTVLKNEKKALEESEIKIKNNSLIKGDINHAHTVGPLSLLELQRSKPFVYTNHISSYEAKFLRIPPVAVEKISDYFIKKSDVIITPSPFGKSLMEKRFDKPIAVISNGIDTEKFSFSKKKREEFRDKYNLKGEKVIYFIGSPIPKKGVYDFIRLAKKFKNRNDIQFVWVGKIHPHLDVNYTIKDLRRKFKNVLFTGFVDDIVAAHSAGDIFIMPSHHELFGIPALEAMACNRPVVTRDIKCYREWLIDSVNCLKFKENLYQVMEEALNKNLYKLVENARKLVEKHNLKNLKETYEEFYRKVRNREFREAGKINSFS